MKSKKIFEEKNNSEEQIQKLKPELQLKPKQLKKIAVRQNEVWLAS
jgi:hypothetical protein